MRVTLLVWLLAPLVVLVILSTIVANHFATSFANKSFDSFLLNSADSIAARVHLGGNSVALADLPPASRDLFRHQGKDKFFYQVVDSDEHILVGDDCFPAQPPVGREHGSFADTLIRGQSVRFCTVPVQIDGRTVWVRVGETLNSRTSLLNQIFLSILVPQVILVGLAGFFVWFGISRGLHPLHRLCETLRARTEPDLSPVDLGHTPAELIPVTEALNHLLHIVDGHCRAQRDFVADAAHQLRTPVTALKTYLDHLRQGGEESVDARTLGQLGAVSNRLADMVNRLLVLARAEARGSHAQNICDGTLAIGEAVAAVVHEALQRNIEMHFDLPDHPVDLGMSCADLTEVMVNLLDNAIKYIPQNGSIWVSLKYSLSGATLDVADDGKGIADEQKEAVFKRFYRLVDTNTPGCGLGLAIVKQLCSAAHVKISLLDREGGGCLFRLEFPALRTQKRQQLLPHNRSNQLLGADGGVLSGTTH